MGQEFLSFFQLETKRLLWLIGISFAVILAFQYLELPYGNVLFSLFSDGKIPASRDSRVQATDPPLESEPESKTNKSLGFEDSDKSSMVNSTKKSDNVSVVEQAGDLGQSSYNNSVGLNNFTSRSGEQNITMRSEHKSGSLYANSPSPSPEIAPTYLTPPINPSAKVSPNITTPVLSNDSNISSFQKDNKTNPMKDESIRASQKDANALGKNSSVNSVPKESKDLHIPLPEVTTVSEMNKLLIHNHASYPYMRPRWSSVADQELLHVRSEIENAPIVKNDPNLYGPLYQNVSMFKRSYELMEETLKVYVYREGAKPILHSPFLTGIYASEGWFMKLMEANKRFVSNDPKKAHLFYLPFSSRLLEEVLYVQNSHSHKNLIQYLKNYVDMIAAKHPFWNRTGGADHFLVACHDWAPAETKEHMAKCIRALCNADVKEGFVFGKDVSLPETYVRNPQNPTKDLGGKRASKKTTLAFFAGRMHGYVRPILLQHWENKDPDMKIFGNLPKSKGDRNYIEYMKSSKYCICAKGYEVNSPRVVEAILYECVPVIISDNFVPPFFEVLNWESFAVVILEKDIPNLKSILLSIPRKRFLRLQMRVKKVKQHFIWHSSPVKYDIFHMILHSIWYNRVFTARAR